MNLPQVKLKEGIHVMHLFYRIDRARWAQLPAGASAAARAKLEQLCAQFPGPAARRVVRSIAILVAARERQIGLEHRRHLVDVLAHALGLGRVADQLELAAAGTVEGMKKTNIPLLFTRAEWDMDNQMAQGDMINKTLCGAGKCPVFRLMKGHNHMSQVYSIGTAETQLTEIMLPFIQQHSGMKAASAK